MITILIKEEHIIIINGTEPLTAGKALYILTTLVGGSKGWRVLISNISSMTRENTGQRAASHQLDLIALAAKNVR